MPEMYARLSTCDIGYTVIIQPHAAGKLRNCFLFSIIISITDVCLRWNRYEFDTAVIKGNNIACQLKLSNEICWQKINVRVDDRGRCARPFPTSLRPPRLQLVIQLCDISELLNHVYRNTNRRTYWPRPIGGSVSAGARMTQARIGSDNGPIFIVTRHTSLR